MSNNIGVILSRAKPVEITTLGSVLAWLSIDSSYDGTKLIACDSRNYMYTSTDSGVTWRQVQIAQDWRVVASSYSGTVLAGVSSNTRGFYVSTNSGVTWSQRITDGTGRSWSGVSISSNGSIIFLCGNGARTKEIFKSTDSGVNWVSQAVGGSLAWERIKVSSNGNYVIACSSGVGGAVYTSSDSGVNWKRQIDTIQRDYNCIAISDDGQILCASTNNGTFYISTNSGVTWVTRALFSTPASISLSSSGNKLVTCVANNGLIYESNDFGQTRITRMTPRKWSCVKILHSNQNIILATEGRENGSSFDSGNIFRIDVDPLIFTDIGSVFKPYSSGNKQPMGIYRLSTYNNWIKQTASGNRKWQSITSSSDGSKLAACINGGYIYTSTDSGATWLDRINAGSQPWTFITSSSNGSILTACVSNGYIWRSTNSGESWTQQASIRNWKAITSSSDGTKIFACEFGQYIWRSINSGLTWRARVDLYDWTSIVCSSNGLIVAATIGNGNIWISNDTGNTWSEKTSSGIRNWSSITSSSNGNLLAACVNGGYIYTSTDSGQSWRENTSSGSRNWYGIASSSNGLILSACANNDFIYTSTNAGQSWIKELFSISNNWYGIASSSLGVNAAACAQNNYIYTQTAPINPDIGLDFNLYKSTNSRLSISTGIFKNETFPYNTKNIAGPLLTPTPPSYTYSTKIYSLSSSSDGTILVAASANSIFKSNDSGRTWYSIPSMFEPKDYGTGFSYGGVAISNNGNVIAAIASTTYLFISTNGGNTWLYKSLASLPGIPVNNGGFRVLLNDDGSKIIVGGVWTLMSTNGGNTWKNIAAAYGGNCQATPDFNVIITGGFNDPLYITKNGTTFTLLGHSTIFPTGNYNQYTFACSSNGEKIAISFINVVTEVAYTNSIYLSTNTGDTWRRVENLPTSTPGIAWRDISLSSDGMTITICARGMIARSTDFGDSWSIIQNEDINWFKVISKVGTNIVASNNYGLTYVSTNSGTSYELTRMPLYQRLTVKGVALSYDGTKIGAIIANGIYISTDRGNSWTNSSIPMSDCFDMAASYDFSVLIADDLSGNVITSTDSGVNWMIQTTLGSKNWSGSCVSGDGNVLGVCESSGYIWISNDKGQTWNQRADSTTWRYIQSSYEGTILIAGRSNNKLWRSIDSGVNWGPITNSPTITGNWGGLHMSNTGEQIIACDQVKGASQSTLIYFFKSIDSGETWIGFSLPTNMGHNHYFYGSNSDANYFAGSADGKIIITGRNSSNLHVSANSGYTFLPRRLAFDATYKALAVSGDGTTVAIGTTTYYTQFLQFYLSNDFINEGVDINTYYEKI